MEHLLAHHTGGTFRAHRGQLFHKVVHVTTNSQLSLGIKIQANSDCEFRVGDREIPVISPNWRTIHINWLNVAVRDPGTSGEPPFDLQQHLQPVQHYMPDALLITSTGHAFDGAYVLPNIMQSMGYTIGYGNTVGPDRGVVCVAFQGEGAMWRNAERGNNIERGIVLKYNWF